MITYYPFTAVSVIDRGFIMFNLYWMVAVVKTIIMTIWVRMHNKLCLYIGISKTNGLSEFVIMTTNLVFELCIMVSVIVFSRLTIYFFRKAAQASGRQWSGRDRQIVSRIACVAPLNLISLLFLFLLSIYKHSSVMNQ